MRGLSPVSDTCRGVRINKWESRNPPRNLRIHSGDREQNRGHTPGLDGCLVVTGSGSVTLPNIGTRLALQNHQSRAQIGVSTAVAGFQLCPVNQEFPGISRIVPAFMFSCWIFIIIPIDSKKPSFWVDFAKNIGISLDPGSSSGRESWRKEWIVVVPIWQWGLNSW